MKILKVIAYRPHPTIWATGILSSHSDEPRPCIEGQDSLQGTLKHLPLAEQIEKTGLTYSQTDSDSCPSHVTINREDDPDWTLFQLKQNTTAPLRIIHIHPSSKPEDILGDYILVDEKTAEVRLDPDKIRAAITELNSHHIVLTGLETNPVMAEFFQTLLSPNPFLFHFGKVFPLHPQGITILDQKNVYTLDANSSQVQPSAENYCDALTQKMGLTLAPTDITTMLQILRKEHVPIPFKTIQTVFRQLKVERDFDRAKTITTHHFCKALSHVLTKRFDRDSTYTSKKTDIYEAFKIGYTKPDQAHKYLRDLLHQVSHESKLALTDTGIHNRLESTVNSLLALDTHALSITDIKDILSEQFNVGNTDTTAETIFNFLQDQSTQKGHVVKAMLWRKTFRNALRMTHHPAISIVGPTGTGKTFMMQQMAQLTDKTVMMDVLNAGTQAEDLTYYIGAESADSAPDDMSVIEGTLLRYANALTEARKTGKSEPFLVLDEATTCEYLELVQSVIDAEGGFADGVFYEITDPHVVFLGNVNYSGRSLQGLDATPIQLTSYKQDVIQHVFVQAIFDAAPKNIRDPEFETQIGTTLATILEECNQTQGISFERLGTRELCHAAGLSLHLHHEFPEMSAEAIAVASILSCNQGVFKDGSDTAILTAVLNGISDQSQQAQILEEVATLLRENLSPEALPSTIHQALTAGVPGIKRGIILKDELALTHFTPTEVLDIGPDSDYETVMANIETCHSEGGIVHINNAGEFESHLWESHNGRLTEKDSTNAFMMVLAYSQEGPRPVISNALFSRCTQIRPAKTIALIDICMQMKAALEEKVRAEQTAPVLTLDGATTENTDSESDGYDTAPEYTAETIVAAVAAASTEPPLHSKLQNTPDVTPTQKTPSLWNRLCLYFSGAKRKKVVPARPINHAPHTGALPGRPRSSTPPNSSELNLGPTDSDKPSKHINLGFKKIITQKKI